MEGQENRKGSRRGRDRPEGNRPGGIRPLLAFLAGIALLAAAAFFLAGRQKPAEGEGLVYEANIVSGDIPGKTREERQRELDAIVEEGMLAFSINATPFMNNGASTANLLIENPPGNGKRFTITIQRNDTEEVIYQSGYLDPEQYIDDVPLDVVLPKGEYPCTAYFDAYRIEDNVYIGRAGAEIKLYVLE